MSLKVMVIKQQKRIGEDEGGFASIVIALVLIIVLGLLSVGYAQLARNEQQTALTKQLSEQAYYAAESGINETYDLLENDIGFAESVNPNQCVPPSDFASDGSYILNSRDSVEFTCVLINAFPSSLQASLSPGESWNTIFQGSLSDSTASAAIKSLDIDWDSADYHNSPAPINLNVNGNTLNENNLPTQTNWGSAPPLLEVTLTALSPTFTRSSLQNNTYTYYLYPKNGEPSTCDEPTVDGEVLCSDTSANGYPYGTHIDNLSNFYAGAGSNTFSVHVVDYYDAANIRIGNGLDINNNSINYEGSQADVDSTGKAKDVLKRIAEVVPLGQPNAIPDSAIEGQNICKQFMTLPSTAGVTTPANPYNVANPNSSSNPCDTDF